MTDTETKTMTAEEALALVGDAETNWFDYYKFSITYSLDTEEFTASLYYGGDSDSVYRFNLNPKTSVSIKGWLEDEMGCKITRKSDGAVFEIEESYW